MVYPPTAPQAKYLLERLAQGHSPKDCWYAIEAAIAGGKPAPPTPERIFSQRWFFQLVDNRKNPDWWTKHRDKLDRVLEETVTAEEVAS